MVTAPAAGADVTAHRRRVTRNGRRPRPATFTATVPAAAEQRAVEGYTFTYFTGEGTLDRRADLLRGQPGQRPAELAASSTAASRSLTSTLGEKGLRDPFIIRSPEGDKFYLIATDLKIYGNGDWDASSAPAASPSWSGSRPTW